MNDWGAATSRGQGEGDPGRNRGRTATPRGGAGAAKRRRSALALRPYPEPLRGRVFRLLAEHRVDVEVPAAIPAGSTNDGVIAVLRDRHPALLLVPFPAMRFEAGQRTTGLELVDRLRAELPHLRRVPVLMPVSVLGQVAFEAAWRACPLEWVLPLLEDDLASEALRASLARILGAPGGSDRAEA